VSEGGDTLCPTLLALMHESGDTLCPSLLCTSAGDRRAPCSPASQRRTLPGCEERVHASSPARAGVKRGSDARPTRADKATLELFDGTHLPAKVVIGADGVHSRARPCPTRVLRRPARDCAQWQAVPVCRPAPGQAPHGRRPAAQVGRALNIPAAEYAGFCAFRRARPRAGRLCSVGSTDVAGATPLPAGRLACL